MHRILAALAIATVLSACQLQPGDYTAIPLSAQQTETVKATIAYRLRDASSAQWRGLKYITRNNGQSYVCGQVNSTNGYGGFTGYVHFWGRWNPDGSFAVQGWPTPNWAAANASVCPG